MKAQEKAAGMLLGKAPARAETKNDSAHHSTQVAYLLSNQRERHVRILASLGALEAFARSLRARLHGVGGAA